MGYAWLLQETNWEENVIAARAGQLNPQTTWIFERLQLEPPILLPDASPRFDSISFRLNTTTPDRPLREAWAIAHRTGGVAPVINSDGTPYGLMTVMSMFNFLSRAIGSHPRREETKIAELFDTPCKEVCDTNVPRFLSTSRHQRCFILAFYGKNEMYFGWWINMAVMWVFVGREKPCILPA